MAAEELFRENPTLSGICKYHTDSLPRDTLRQGLGRIGQIFIKPPLTRLNSDYIGRECLLQWIVESF